MLYLIGKMVERGLDHWSDILVVVIYFVAVLAVGLWVGQFYIIYVYYTYLFNERNTNLSLKLCDV